MKAKIRKTFSLKTGNYYYADVTKAHEVHNTWDQDRLHLVADCYSNETIRNLILE
jgi:aspartyl/asparaginyl beta-hydroxylase (cupin superfamily)